MQVYKPSAQKWLLLLGWIGMTIAGARKGGPLRYEIPYCDNCHRQDLILRVVLVGVPVLAMLFFCCTFAPLSQVKGTGDASDKVFGALAILSIAMIPLTMVIGLPTAVILRMAHLGVHIKRVNERNESMQVACRNPSYFEQFRERNLGRIVSYSLRHGKQLPVSPDRAIAIVGQRIDEQNPRSPVSLKGYFERGQLYLRAGMYEQALADLNRVVEVTGLENPHFVEAQFFRGQAHMHLGNSMQAQTDLENYVRASSDRARVQQAKQWLQQLESA